MYFFYKYIFLLHIDFTHEIRHYFYIVYLFMLIRIHLVHIFDTNLLLYCNAKSLRARINRIFHAEVYHLDNYNKISFRGNNIRITVI